MQKYSKEMLYHESTECYGCNNITTNESGMCDNCGGSANIAGLKPKRTRHTIGEAYDMIERGN
jgi:rRNA maturation endonuclease Nob1